MGIPGQLHTQAAIPAKSYDTALCIIPPQHRREEIDKLRSLYDKAYEKWPPHINLIYPFVASEHLWQAKDRIESHIHTTFSETSSLTVALGGAGIFKHKEDTTVFLQASDGREENILGSVRSAALQALGLKVTSSTLHLTVGQAQDSSVASRQYLVDKVNLLPAFELDVQSLAILIREKIEGKTDTTSQMRLWGTIDLPFSHKQVQTPLDEFWIRTQAPTRSTLSPPGPTYTFNKEVQKWCISIASPDLSKPETLCVSSYNVLLDSEYPPSHDRDPLLVETILTEFALSHVLVLQEVSDDFLSYLLQKEEVRKTYPFSSHGPPSQADIGPLPSLRNIVILSKWHFNFEIISFHRRHKGAIVASFPSLLIDDRNPLVVAGVHLTAGLTNGSVAAKKVQLQNVITHIQRNYPSSVWLIAGDFNLPTSRYTIDEAVKQKDISLETSGILHSTESTLYEAELLDAWAIARVEGVDRTAALDADGLSEGEEGATFNPRENPLAAYISGTAENRPQRYDRIFVRSQGKLDLINFNRFGLPERVDGTTSVASDHYGIRAMFKVQLDPEHQGADNFDIPQQLTVSHQHIPPELSFTAPLEEVLSKRGVSPTIEDENRYRNAFRLVKNVLLGGAGEKSQTPDIPLIVVPVGSYALNVWTSDSDIDCLCIGSISSKTFFHLAHQRIHKAEHIGVRLLRKVQANTGTMLELSVNGVNMDLQYCPAANVVQRWPDFLTLPATDPIFNLSNLSLRKLKPIRDLAYVQRTLPSMASFRLAYRFIKRWAVDRGIYSAKFGYFGGIHITLLLSWVCKRLAHDTGSVSVSELVITFFHYYAHFDWQNGMVYDVFFHKKKPRYQRSSREPIVILGFYAPNSNIAHTATAPSLEILVHELKQAEGRLFTSGMTWEKFFDVDIPAIEGFLTSFESYVKIDIQYWGRTLSRGKGLVGWVESRCINLVVDIHKALPQLSLRIWPNRLAERDANDSEAYYRGCYLIGISRSDDGSAISKEDRAEAKATLQNVFDSFLTQVRADDRYYDESSAWIGVSLAKPSDMKNLQLDDREWGDYVPGMDPDSEDESNFDELDDDFTPSTVRKLPTRAASSGISAPISSNKLRPASDVLNRLRWDSNLDPSGYIVGYEDRFLGVKELSLEKWKTEQTDEEFIPQHRILYFKKKGEVDGEVVWERSSRIDKIFGSGIGNGE